MKIHLWWISQKHWWNTSFPAMEIRINILWKNIIGLVRLLRKKSQKDSIFQKMPEFFWQKIKKVLEGDLASPFIMEKNK